eukprot:SAG22_NODE_5424_length_1016_cov_0.998909_2_plen_168_part_01
MVTETNPHNAVTSFTPDKEALIPYMEKLAEQKGYTAEMMSDKLSNLTRKAFAGAADRHFQYTWSSLDESVLAEMRRAASTRETVVPDASVVECLDLGHELASLWALTDNESRAEELFRQILAVLPLDRAFYEDNNATGSLPRTSSHGGKDPELRKRGARRDRTAAALQ